MQAVILRTPALRARTLTRALRLEYLTVQNRIDLSIWNRPSMTYRLLGPYEREA
jgi:hypothetical protein